MAHGRGGLVELPLLALVPDDKLGVDVGRPGPWSFHGPAEAHTAPPGGVVAVAAPTA